MLCGAVMHGFARSFFAIALCACGASDSTDPVSPDAKPEALGFTPVPCLDDERTFTDLSSVARELGFDELAYVDSWNQSQNSSPEKRDIVFRVSSGSALDVCTSQACKDLVLATTDAAMSVLLAKQGPSREPTNDAPWSEAHEGGPSFKTLIARRNETYTAVNTTGQLRDLIGPIDSPWKAHLLIFASDDRYDVSCRVRVAYHQWQRTFIRTGTPNEILGVAPAPQCSKQAEARRVLLGVNDGGESSVRSSAIAWVGPTDCE